MYTMRTDPQASIRFISESNAASTTAKVWVICTNHLRYSLWILEHKENKSYRR
jgi:hypothetical protein